MSLLATTFAFGDQVEHSSPIKSMQNAKQSLVAVLWFISQGTLVITSEKTLDCSHDRRLWKETYQCTSVA